MRSYHKIWWIFNYTFANFYRLIETTHGFLLFLLTKKHSLLIISTILILIDRLLLANLAEDTTFDEFRQSQSHIVPSLFIVSYHSAILQAFQSIFIFCLPKEKVRLGIDCEKFNHILLFSMYRNLRFVLDYLMKQLPCLFELICIM